MVNFSLKIGGEAGFGIMTTGLVFSKIATRLGYYIFDYVEYPSLVRGGHNAYEINIADYPINHLKKTIDLLVCLNKETFDRHRFRLTRESFVIYDPDEFEINDDYQKIAIPFKKILKELNGQEVMKNTVALGATLAVVGGDINELLEIIKNQFLKKGEAVVKLNQSFAQRGYQEAISQSENKKDWLKRLESKDNLVINGNEAFALGAVVSDCRLYCAYPMTPSSSVLHTLAGWQDKTGMVVRHAEDEISVINTALGASFAGIRSAVGTSGGGFALMVESISLAGITETPIVIFLAQRPGPATGMPTWTEQGDLLFACFAGHGEFPKIVLAPGDQEEMFELTLTAFNLADVYQLPVIILSDMFLSEGHKTVNRLWLEELIKNYQVDRGKLKESLDLDTPVSNSQPRYQSFLRYKIEDDGISERILPGLKNYYFQANSYEHLEDGHTTEDSQPRINQVNKRNQKWQTFLEKDFKSPKYYGNKDAEIVFVSWGSNKGTIMEAQKQLDEKGVKTGFWHFTYLYPLAKQVKEFFSGDKRYILVENNSWSQFGKLLKMEIGFEIQEKILRYDGRPVSVEDIIKKLES